MAATTSVDHSDAATVAFLAFLRTESDLCLQRAKALRSQADQLASLYGITQHLQDRYELGPECAAPLDENGIPKYRGKKRGRKPKERKRKLNPNRRKRAHTAYTLFVHEQYPVVKGEHPDWQSKEVISVVARMWAAVPKEEKRTWKERALSTAVRDREEEEEEEDDDDEDDDEEEDVEEDDDEANDEEKEATELSILESADAAA